MLGGGGGRGGGGGVTLGLTRSGAHVVRYASQYVLFLVFVFH